MAELWPNLCGDVGEKGEEGPLNPSAWADQRNRKGWITRLTSFATGG